MDLENKVVLVTGGSGGLGAEICYEAAKQGAIVITCARRVQQINEVKEKCRQLSGNPAYAFQLDVSDPESVEELYEQVKREVGTVDILVNNAGFGIFEDFLSFDLGRAYDMFEVNVLGMMVLTQKFAIDMAENRQGHIINIASMAGKMATAKSTVYSATKFAVIGFSNALRLELKPLGVAVTTVNPGPIETDFFGKADPSGSYLEKVGKLVLDSTKLAKIIVRNMKHPKREINQPVILEIAAKFYGLFPTIGDYLAGGIFNKK
ncbi:short chain dehydrogenase/reductase family oxidoreductase [Enterococcus sp. 10A9_DIV0425]|uniref:Short chain dehydrogenase/reductase family oxidoreductase n=1 Tax=Candidatus Enterococcus wittei TaxID=1987383 RepID=A0A2C9XP33_9ENTE|nr:SDR family oxidoreductase [Enterococcus sp. 10A9_DIV0425]OTP11965.1 short chain dehydrogenase/reductase family oxidoreductase [Enterococcus sp. 10A9_DIV0425]THE16026.1 SDR family oxidoreductase [Enterococcus hirae]